MYFDFWSKIGNKYLLPFLDINECITLSPCANGGTCLNVDGSFLCTCPVGWTGTTCKTGEIGTYVYEIVLKQIKSLFWNSCVVLIIMLLAVGRCKWVLSISMCKW